MHTLKGNAAYLELHSVELVAHACEDLASLPRDRGVPFDARMVDLMLEALDKLRWAIAYVGENKCAPPDEEVAEIVARLQDSFTELGGKRAEKDPDQEGFTLFDDEEPPMSLPTPMAAAGDQETKAQKKAASTRDDKVVPIEKSEVLRVDASKVSALMDLAGELGLACSAVTRHPELDGLDLDGFAAAAHRLEILVREIQTDLSSLRLVAVSPVFQRMRRVVRDAAKRSGKEVDLVIVGEETEVDKVMIDALQDPLVHVLRNAVDHGIETPEARVAAGKGPRGKIVLSACHQGGEVSIEVKDDGKGIDKARVVARARERALIPMDAELTDEEAHQLLFVPGFSTKETVDSLSGRGVGMDVLKTTVEGLRGHVALKSVPGQGSRISLNMPLTLAFVEAMVVREGDRLFALPIEKVFEVSKIGPLHLVESSANRQTLLRVRDQFVPILRLREFWDESAVRTGDLEGHVVVVVQTERGAVALPVDELIGNQQVMLKPLHGPLSHIRAAAGCGMLRTGDVAIALDCDRLYA
jgi:two-component system chemotaxis sensor kinase CheA